MDVIESPSSSSAKRSPNVKPSVSDEKDQSLHFRQLGFCNTKNPSPKKNLPSGGASKVTPPENKVLTERNRSNHPVGNIPISYSEPVKASPSTSGSKISPSSSADGHGKESLLPYGQYTNYLSPRPQFLRYKPDRQREFALRLEKEKEVGKGKEGSSLGGSPNETGNVNGEGAGSVSSCDILKLEGEEDHGDSDDEVEEEEGEEEQRSSICQELLKTLLLLVVLVFPASSYMSDMNSASSISHEVGVSEDGYWRIENFTYEETALHGRALGLGCGSNLMNHARESENEVGFLVKNVDSIDELEDQEEVVEFGLGAIENSNDDGNEEGLAVVDVGEEPELSLEDSSHTDQGIVKPDEVSDQLTEGFELQQSKNAENLDFEIPTALDMQATLPWEPETQTSVRIEVEKEWGRTDEESGVNFPIGKPEAELNNEVLMVRIGTESIYNAIIGLLAVSLAISAAFLFRLFSKGKRNPANPVCSSPLKKQLCPEPVAEEKHEPQFQKKEQDCTEPLVPNSIKDPSPIYAPEEASAQSNQSRAPKIELLGEFVVGELSSSHRSREVKSKMIGKVEESTNSVSTDKSRIKVNVTQPTFSGFSSMDSPSHGSFTADRNFKKPQEDGTGESRTAVATSARRSSRIQNTPVRRSSRIRNLAIQSP
ncbi:uncharacterized protein LOC115737544 [Rhodamnia argentea]|uniref:Uncharacterized protein LOC115737544 n=1 Tax=Rhodamnia argentea TaxID=178133 RepID=A0A8B8NTP9_9MYRT|nr:uncharacterized protein LOC115737544 [Rhodamnia argentea]